MSSEGTEIDLHLLSASLRADASDLGVFVDSLAARLEDALPGRARVYRWRERMFGSKLVRKITIDAGDQRLELEYKGGALQTTCARMSGGIVLKTEPLDFDAWLTALTEALAAEAQRNEVARKALERLLMQ
ncbi:MAG: hypothetical protein JO286_12415 [Solirubrobacterales bacterium]|nr:hypothetical protein [Solirubrobacterales bacterium]MBV9680821.1 hypothetical protein [Solirubrobacterales bacterium]MBV9807984.1 hypothetical protein [Solirubrobacterales bacterium]